MAIKRADADGRMVLLILVRAVRFACVGALAFMVANCGQSPRTSRLSGQESREIGSFSDKKYGSASPRVVEDGEAVPKGGGRDQVGRPYVIAGKRYVPREKPTGYSAVGNASWYGPAFHGRRTANGEVYDRHGISAAHPTMPLPSYARVTNLRNKRSIIVRVNDRGPFHANRIIDLSQKTADALEFRHIGTATVKVEYLGRASMRGSDDRKLLATLSTDGRPASLPGSTEPATMIASAEPVTAPAATTVITQRPQQVAALSASDTLVFPAASVSPLNQRQAAVEPVELPAGRIVRGIPSPPDRPFDLGTIPNAGTPVAVAVPGVPDSATSRSQVASLFYAAPQSTGRFDRKGPWANLKTAGFMPLGTPPR